MTPVRRHEHEIDVDDLLVRRLLRTQFPAWADLPLELVEPSGTDHTIYRLGADMAVRMPIVEGPSAQAAKEARWLPFLAPRVPLLLPTPLALGEPGEGFPWNWSVVSWIDGERADPTNIDLEQAAVDLARFVTALQACDATDGPASGRATGGRGLSIAQWAEPVRNAIAKLGAARDELAAALVAWDEVLDTPEWDGPPVWFHGDLSWNLIAKHGRLIGVIDSGYGVGDPACDLMPGWTLFRGEARRRFFDEVGLDDATRIRARGWALAPAFIGLNYYRAVPHLQANARLSIEGALAD